jgi:putative membrane protein
VVAVDRMSRWCRRLTGGTLAAITLILLNPQIARADPGVPAPLSGLSAELGVGGLSDADRAFIARVRLAGLLPELSAEGLSDADRDFIIRVRLAGRWALPS